MFGWACCFVMAQIQFSLIKKNKNWTPEHSLIPHPHTSDNISFLSTPTLPPPPSKWTSYVYHTISVRQQRFSQSSRPLKKMRSPNMVSLFKHNPFKISLLLWGSGMDLEPKANIKYLLPITVLCVLSLSPFRISNCRSNIF